MSELRFEMRAKRGCGNCRGSGFICPVCVETGCDYFCWPCTNTHGYPLYIEAPKEPCPCRRPTAMLKVDGTEDVKKKIKYLLECEYSDAALLGFAIKDEEGEWKQPTRRLLRWTGKEPLDLEALAEADPECQDCGGSGSSYDSYYDTAFAGGFGCPCRTLRGVDGLVVVGEIRGCSCDSGDYDPGCCPGCEDMIRWTDVEDQAERLGLEVEYE